MEPIVKTITVRRSPDEAFRLFTAEVARWWPLATHHLGRLPPVACAIVPVVGGRIYETAPDGTEQDWGRVLAWDPPGRFAMSWDVGIATELVLAFTPVSAGCEVQLRHDGWAGQQPARRAAYEAAWDIVLVGHYGRFAGRIGMTDDENAGGWIDQL